MTIRRALEATLAGLALIKCLLAAAGFFVGTPTELVTPRPVQLLLIASFAGVGGFLLHGGRKDPRASFLGMSWLLTGAAFSNEFLKHLQGVAGASLGAVFLALRRVDVPAFLPLYLTLFATYFPESPQRLGRTHRLILWLLAAIGGLMFLVPFLEESERGPILGRVANFSTAGLQYVLCLVPILVAYFRKRPVTLAESRRGRLFLASIFVGAAPVAVCLILEFSVPAFSPFMLDTPLGRTVGALATLSLATIPFTTTYSVVRHKVLDVKLIARKALQHLLARFTVAILTLAPLGGLVAFLVTNRDQTLTQLFSGPSFLILALLTGAGLVGLRSREGILRFVDVKFFAEQHASWEFLGQLAKEFRLSSTTAELARDIANGIDRALHLETVAVLVHSRKTGRLVDPAEQCQPFDPTSELGKLASANHAPLETDLTDPNTPLKSLPEEDRYWIADNRFRLLVPLSSMDGSLLGLIGLGERRSGSPFLAEDLKLLDTLADSAAIKLELLLMHENELPDQRPPTLPANPDEHLRPARECVRCGTALSPEALSCGRCDRPTELQEARVPYILPGRLRFQRRIGSGGMGIVYLAMDLKLGTTRAVKTLRRVSPEDSVRLQAEARIAAAVTHPNLATVYGIESWRGTPMLILEHLPNGTLLQRLSRKPLGLSETLRLGLAITGAVERLHDHGILHRDIKPSNIGFAQDETPKLMDFGIARVQVDPRRDGGSDRRSLPADAAATPTILWTRRGPSRASQKLIGTVSYLPPEAFRKGFEADPSTDLWALCLVLYECLTGEQVFTGDEIGKIIQDIRKGVPPLEEIWREAELPLCQFFERNLASDRARRAPTASALMRELQRLSSSLQADDRQAVN